MSATKEVDDLVRAIKATGTYDVLSDNSHHKVINPAGNQVYVLPRSPSDHRWRENAVHDLIRVGVLASDPRKNGGGKKSRSRLTDPDIRAKKLAGIKVRAERLASETATIRDRLTPLINKVGGWGAREGQITAIELGSVVRYWGRDRPDVFGTEDAARSSVQGNMRHGGSCSDQALGFWDAFVTDWELADDPRTWYFDLVREMKGLEPIEKNVFVGGAPVPPTGQKNHRRAGRVKTYVAEDKRHPLEPDHVVGHLALRATALMAAGRENIDIEEVLEVGEQILALEAEASREGE